MGNEQSDTRQRNYKVYKIIRIDREHSGWFRCYLDDDVPYSNGEREYMDFETETALSVIDGLGGMFGVDMPRRAYLSEGKHILVDTNYTREHESSHNFSGRNVRNVNVRDSGSSLSGEGGFQGLVGEISEARERYARASEWSNFDKQMQRAWQLQPPKK